MSQKRWMVGVDAPFLKKPIEHQADNPFQPNSEMWPICNDPDVVSITIPLNTSGSLVGVRNEPQART
jgi:hypothetical protein